MNGYRLLRTIVCASYAAVCALLGGVDSLLTALLFFMAADVATGAALAVVKKNLSSRVFLSGICRKCVTLLLVAAANAVDVFVLRDGSLTRTAVILFYIAGEGLSLVENAGALGLPVPRRLRDALEKLKE